MTGDGGFRVRVRVTGDGGGLGLRLGLIAMVHTCGSVRFRVRG